MLSVGDCRLADLTALVVRDVPLYQAKLLREADRAAVCEQLVYTLSDGPGIVIIRGAFPAGTVHRVTEEFAAIIAEQHAAGAARGDHFAKPGANDRVWNALEKLAVRAPGAFVDYYANDILALVSEAWLGPGYQVTSQVNVVNPGGAGQVGHRDYHLGFLPPDRIERFPEHVHRLSPVLTLQAAVAHTDMPVESGPTCYLPGSQRYRPGYLATQLPEFREYFEEHHVQLPLELGDAVFFNPAVIHGAGANRTTDVQRMANLLQVSSPFGRAMETVDRERVCNAIYPALVSRAAADPSGAGHALAAAAEGYPFPTDLDADPPVDGLAPPSQADLVRQALDESWPAARLRDRLAEQAKRRGGGR